MELDHMVPELGGHINEVAALQLSLRFHCIVHVLN